MFSHVFPKSPAENCNPPYDVGPNMETEGGPPKRRKLSQDHNDIAFADRVLKFTEEAIPASLERKQEPKDTTGTDILQKYKIKASKISSNVSRAISPPPLRARQPHATINQERGTASQAHVLFSRGNGTLRGAFATTTGPPSARAGFDIRDQCHTEATNPNLAQHPDFPMSDMGSDQAVHKQLLPSESLNPRSLPSPPATHAVRLKLCQLLQAQYLRLNDLMISSNHPSKLDLTLSSQAIITNVLNEEEQAAKAHPTIYTNILKSRISTLKKITPDEYYRQKEHESLTVRAGSPKPDEDDPKTEIRTGLTETEEKTFLKYIVANHDTLVKYEYITKVPSPSEIQNASDGVMASHNHETCERCSTRFQVFPGRRPEDGALTTGGHCKYHSGKVRHHRQNGPSTYTCCNEEVGKSAGCTTANSHVFKPTSPARLAVVLPFVETPRGKKSSTKDNNAIALDCEMGFTTMGFETTRITAVAFPSGKVLVDALVRPEGEILDLNSSYSGVYASDFAAAIELDEHITPILRAYERAVGKIRRLSISAKSGGSKNATNLPKTPLPLCTSIDQARRLLFEHISSTTPIIGHGLENDLKALRIVHPTVIDTAILYPSDRKPDQNGRPNRYSLKNIMWWALRRKIQDSASGHDSCEDARSAMDLVRYHMASEWRKKRDQGLVLDDGKFRDPGKDSDSETGSSGSE